MATKPATQGQSRRPSSGGGSKPAANRAVGAVEAAVAANVTTVRLPALGQVSLPPVDHLVWYGGVAVLTAAELLEWPVALVLAVGKMLADNRSHRTLRSLGDALEQAG